MAKDKLNRRDENGRWIDVPLEDRPHYMSYVKAEWQDLPWYMRMLGPFLTWVGRHTTASGMLATVALWVPLMVIWDVPLWFAIIVGVPALWTLRLAGWLDPEESPAQRLKREWHKAKYKQTLDRWDGIVTRLEEDWDK